MITIRCDDKTYKETKIFKLNWDGSREDQDEMDELRERCLRYKKWPIQDLSRNVEAEWI